MAHPPPYLPEFPSFTTAPELRILKVMKKLVCVLCALPLLMLGDSLKLKNGSSVQGVVRTIAGGNITIEVGGQNRVIKVLDVEEIDFDTPHANEVTGSADKTVNQFTKGAESLTKARKTSRSALDQIKGRWAGRKSVEPGQVTQWNAEKERFLPAFTDYRKSIQELYRDVAAQVDNYNKLGAEANSVYVGVKGIFNVGSPLVPDDQRELQLKQFLPGTWYDELYYEAYSKGFKDAVEQQQLLNPRPTNAN